MKYTVTQSRILYTLKINDDKHENLLKIGEVLVDNDIANSGGDELKNAVCEILGKRKYMAGVTYELITAACTTYGSQCYKAADIHQRLKEQNFSLQYMNKIGKGQKEQNADIWFQCDTTDVVNAIEYIKNNPPSGKKRITRADLRPEQINAIDSTVKHFRDKEGVAKKKKHFLWNAKMRFGKTLCGLEVAKEMNYATTLIVTHRPVVDKGWHDDFEKIFGDLPDYVYATRMNDDNNDNNREEFDLTFFESIKNDVQNKGKRLICFVSMQFLRGLSDFEKGRKETTYDSLKRAIMEYDWDFVIVDEAHEGIEAKAGARVMAKLDKDTTHILSLSGTPFNLLEKYKDTEIYTWDYVMEQQAKLQWDDEHFGDPNPYAELPRMQILTFTLPRMIRNNIVGQGQEFHLHEFFRVWDKKELEKQNKSKELEGMFVYENDIKTFLDKLVSGELYPFSKDVFRENFKHTFWILPGVKEAAAMEKLLKAHGIFGNGNFCIINVAGDTEDDKDGKALYAVLDNIRGYDPKDDRNNAKPRHQEIVQRKDRTITLSCGKLTTGVSVPEWTAVLCMKGSENTPASSYMQTIFRVQTHAVIAGKQKSDCYVFDFAPDRALTAVAETAKITTASNSDDRLLKLSQGKEHEHLAAFINLCPVLSMDEGQMGNKVTAAEIFEKLKNVYIERAVRSGYADNSIYNHQKVMVLSAEQERILNGVYSAHGSKQAFKVQKIDINKEGLNKAENEWKDIYYLSDDETVPATPSKSVTKLDAKGRPTSEDEGWSDDFQRPDETHRYSFRSHCEKQNDEWTDFSEPALWSKFQDEDPQTKDTQEKRAKENAEKRARMSVLRVISIRIPLLVYGAAIPIEEKITVDNFAEDRIIDQASWDEFMPSGFTKEKFNALKDCFDQDIFSGAADRIRQLVNTADALDVEDRIARIAKIFSFLHNPDKETVLTPWRVVNMHMSDCLGGECFYNEEFEEIQTRLDDIEYLPKCVTRFVDRGEVTKNVFCDPNARILEINSKTGLYPLYVAYSLFKYAKEPAYRDQELTEKRRQVGDNAEYAKQANDDQVIWGAVLQENIFVICRTKMAASITKRTLAGFSPYLQKFPNVICYEHEIEVSDLVKAGVKKDRITSRRDGTYLYDGKTTVKAEKLLEHGVLNEDEVVREGKNILYAGKMELNINDLVAKGKLKQTITQENDTYYFHNRKSISCDVVDVIRAKKDVFLKDVVKGKDFWHINPKAFATAKEEDINNMKFKAIVGNPPYHVLDAGDGAPDAGAPIYPKFISLAQELKPNYLSMIMPSKWMVGGRIELASFLEHMKSDPSLSYVKDYRNDHEIFPTAHNDGGICYFLWDSNKKTEELRYEYVSMSGEVVANNTLNNNFTQYVIRDARIVPILNKIYDVVDGEDKTMRFSSLVSKTQPFGIRKDIFNSPERYPESSLSEFPFEDSVRIFGVKGKKGGAKRQIGYVSKKVVDDKYGALPKYKIFFTTTYSSDAVIPPEIIRGIPGDICTETFLLIGPFDTEEEMKNCASYIETMFFRFVLFFGHGTMQVNQGVFDLIPREQFTKKMTDDDLFRKYKLSPEQVDFIKMFFENK